MTGFVSGIATIVSNAKSLFGIKIPGVEKPPSYSDLWAIDGQDWYKIYPYTFTIRNISKSEKKIGGIDAGGFFDKAKKALTAALTPPMMPGEDDDKVYTLPIPPQSMSVSQVQSSMATPTIGGVVEEVSANTFWQISLAGTTAIAPSRTADGSPELNRQTVAKKFREAISTTGLLAGISTELNSTINKVGGLIDQGIEAYESFAEGDIAGGIGDVVGAVNNALLPTLPYSASGVDGASNGYTEIHELSKFFFYFSQIKAADPHKWALFFTDFKNNQEWRCVVQNLTVQRNAQNPFLFRYQIVLKGWEVKAPSVDNREKLAFNRFGPSGDLKAVNTVGFSMFDMLGKTAMNVYGGDKESGSKGKAQTIKKIFTLSPKG